MRLIHLSLYKTVTFSWGLPVSQTFVCFSDDVTLFTFYGFTVGQGFFGYFKRSRKGKEDT